MFRAVLRPLVGLCYGYFMTLDEALTKLRAAKPLLDRYGVARVGASVRVLHVGCWLGARVALTRLEGHARAKVRPAAIATLRCSPP